MYRVYAPVPARWPHSNWLRSLRQLNQTYKVKFNKHLREDVDEQRAY